MLLYLLAGLLAYLIGSIPFAYFIVRSRSGGDIRNMGSGNVGAMNAFAVTGSKWSGALVFGLDFLKGVAAVLVAQMLAPDAASGLWFSAIGLLGSVAGHNYNLWLSLSSGELAGGKGLATTAGALLMFYPWVVLVWVAAFLLGRWAYSKWRTGSGVIPGNVVATVIGPFAGWIAYSPTAFVIVGLVSLLILPKHTTQFMESMRAPLVEPAS